MKNKRFYFRTISAFLIITLLFMVIHVYNNLEIQSIKFTDEWAKPVKTGKGSMKKSPLLGKMEDKILTVTFTKVGKPNYYLTSKDGTILDNGISDLEDFNKNKIDDIYLLENRLFYISDNKLYVSTFQEKAGFSVPKILNQNMNGFNIEELDGVNYLQSYNDTKIQMFTIEEDSLKTEQEFENNWNLKGIFLREIENQKFIFLVNKASDFSDVILGGTIEESGTLNIQEIDNLTSSNRDYLGQIYIEAVEDNFIIGYPVKRIVSGTQTVSVELKVVDSKEMKVDVRNSIVDNINGVFYDMDPEIEIYSDSNGVHILGSAKNINNKYANYSDIFQGDLDIEGNLNNVRFISSTESYSRTPSILKTESGQYLGWLDLQTGSYDLMLSSTDESFSINNSSYSRDDYKSAILKAATSPFYAMAFSFLKAFQIFMFMSGILLLAEYLMRKTDLSNEKLKLLIFIVLYIIVNIILFKGVYYKGEILSLMPDILKFDFSYLVMPLIINIISAMILLVFHVERKEMNYIAYAIFFMAVDIFLGTLLYIPFSMVKTLSM